MSRAASALSLALDLVARLVILLAGAALVVLLLITGWMVFGRYVLNDTPTWVERAALLVILFVALPVAAVGVRERFHMAVEIVVAALPAGLRAGTAIAVDLLTLGFGLVMLAWADTLAAMMWGFRIPLLGVPQGLQFVPMMICGGLTALFAAEHLLRRAARLPPLGQRAAGLE
jgi:TRAP-type C4-dicarboxylate transport system permease small subunit